MRIRVLAVCLLTAILTFAGASSALAITKTKITGISSEKAYNATKYTTQNPDGSETTVVKAKVSYKGRLINSSTRKPIPNVKVKVYRTGGENPTGSAYITTKTTNKYGYFTFSQSRRDNTKYTFKSAKTSKYASASRSSLALIAPNITRCGYNDTYYRSSGTFSGDRNNPTIVSAYPTFYDFSVWYNKTPRYWSPTSMAVLEFQFKSDGEWANFRNLLKPMPDVTTSSLFWLSEYFPAGEYRVRGNFTGSKGLGYNNSRKGPWGYFTAQ